MRRLLLILGSVVVLGVVAFLLLRREPPASNGTIPGSNVAPPVQNTNQAPPTVEEARNTVIGVSRAFAERYGSTTSDRPTAHLTGAAAYVSTALRAAFERQAAAPVGPAETPKSVTSQALAFNVRAVDERSGRADVVVSLRRTEHVGTKPSVTYVQDLTLLFVREAGAWRVNVASWGAEQR